MSPDVIARLREHRLFIVHFAIVVCVLSIGTWAVYLLFDKPELGIDDARIFFVYGENIVEGNGIVFNSGGERVEGFTSPLWLFLVVAAHALFNRPDIYLLIFSLLILSAAISVLWYSEISRKLISWQSAMFLLWIVGAPTYIVWMSLPLMDATIWSAILIIAAVITIRANSPVLMALCMIPLVLTRPEGIIWGLVLLSLFGIGIGAKRGAAPAWRAIRLPASVFLFTIVVLIVGRLAYFGYPLPNTYYAKVSPDAIYNLTQGIVYLMAFIASNRLALIVVLWTTLAGLLFNLPKFIRKITSLSLGVDSTVNVRYMIVSVIAITGLLVPILSGGDHFRLLRFYQPVWPLLFLPVLALFTTIKLPNTRSVRYGLTIGFVAMMLLGPGVRWDVLANDAILLEFDLATKGSILGKQLNEMFQDNLPSVGHPTVGGFAQEYDGEVVDIYGLNNVAIAHASGNRYGWKNHAAFSTDMFIELQPDLFLPVAGTEKQLLEGTVETIHIPFVDNIYYDPRFIRLYSLAIVTSSENGIRAFVRRDLIGALLEQGFEVLEIDY